MLMRWHILFGFVISCILVHFFKFSPLAGIIIFLSSILIDLDHLFWYAYDLKTFNILRAFKDYNSPKARKLLSKCKNTKRLKKGVYIFHDVFFWTILLTLSFFFQLFLWIFIGIIIHILADLIQLKKEKQSLMSKISIFYTINKNKKKSSWKDLIS